MRNILLKFEKISSLFFSSKLKYKLSSWIPKTNKDDIEGSIKKRQILKGDVSPKNNIKYILKYFSQKQGFSFRYLSEIRTRVKMNRHCEIFRTNYKSV